MNKRSKGNLLWRFMKGSKLMFLISMLAAVLSALADMLTPQIVRISVDTILSGEEADLPQWVTSLADRLGGFSYIADHMWIMAIAILLVAVLKVTGLYTNRVCNTRASETLVKTMRDTLYSHIERLPFSWHMQNKTGDIIQRCTSDIDTTKHFVSEQMTSMFRIIVMLVLSIVFMLSMNGWLTLVAVIPVPFVLFYSIRFHKKISRDFKDCDENEGKLSAIAQENLTGVRVVRAFGRERYEKDKFEAQNQFYTDLWVKLAKPMATYWSTSDVLAGLQIMLIVVFGALFCIQGKMAPGEYIAFISYGSMLTWPVRALGRMISEMSKAGVSLERIQYIMDAREEVQEGRRLRPDMNGDICFEHVTFSYDERQEIIKDIDFTMKAGTTLGILGGTGSGKSTMMLLLDKLYPLPAENGRITIGGVDIHDIDTAYLRENVGMVLQEPYLFSRTIGENIGVTMEDMDMEAIKEAARTACLDETVENFTKGYDTFVGERGVTLSGGQKQRAAIARMLTQKTPIMIFDDSLSAVDTETDAKIRTALEAKFGSAAIILISHRITTLSKADKILVLDKGRIVEEGSHEELKNAGGIYQKICEIQSGTDSEEVRV